MIRNDNTVIQATRCHKTQTYIAYHTTRAGTGWWMPLPVPLKTGRRFVNYNLIRHSINSKLPRGVKDRFRWSSNINPVGMII